MEDKIRHVQDAAFWGKPVGTPIVAGMRPKKRGTHAPKEVTSGSHVAGTHTSGTGRIVGKKPMMKVPGTDRKTQIAKLQARWSKIAHKGRKDGAGTETDPIDCGGDVDKAIQLLADGKHVRLNQPDQVATMLDKLRAIADEAKAKGEKAPNYDLCKVSVPKTNLFCKDNKHIERIKMPQFGGSNIRPGSLADSMPRNKKGEVDTADLFEKMVKERGTKIEEKTVKASHLRASQMELVGTQVAGMANAYQTGDMPKEVGDAPIFVTRDGYIIDGHHRWAMKIAVDLQDNHLGDVDMKVKMIDMDIGEALDLAWAFTEEVGILPKSGSTQPATKALIDEVRGFISSLECADCQSKNERDGLTG